MRVNGLVALKVNEEGVRLTRLDKKPPKHNYSFLVKESLLRLKLKIEKHNAKMIAEDKKNKLVKLTAPKVAEEIVVLAVSQILKRQGAEGMDRQACKTNRKSIATLMHKRNGGYPVHPKTVGNAIERLAFAGILLMEDGKAKKRYCTDTGGYQQYNDFMVFVSEDVLYIPSCGFGQTLDTPESTDSMGKKMPLTPSSRKLKPKIVKGVCSANSLPPTKLGLHGNTENESRKNDSPKNFSPESEKNEKKTDSLIEASFSDMADELIGAVEPIARWGKIYESQRVLMRQHIFQRYEQEQFPEEYHREMLEYVRGLLTRKVNTGVVFISPKCFHGFAPYSIFSWHRRFQTEMNRPKPKPSGKILELHRKYKGDYQALIENERWETAAGFFSLYALHELHPTDTRILKKDPTEVGTEIKMRINHIGIHINTYYQRFMWAIKHMKDKKKKRWIRSVSRFFREYDQVMKAMGLFDHPLGWDRKHYQKCQKIDAERKTRHTVDYVAMLRRKGYRKVVTAQGIAYMR